jgi:membrane protein DedA with SNARE-associated domain
MLVVESAIPQPPRFSNRARLTLFLVPIALAFSSAQVAKAMWPTLLTEAPWTLLAMSSSTTRMLLVQPLVPAHVFFGLALARPLLLVPLYYCFGRCFGDAALRWVERKLGPDSRVISRVEHYFRRFSYALVAWSPNGAVSVMAGATRMRARTFFLVAAIGTLVKVTIVYYLGDALSAPLHDVANFVGRYQWYLTPLTFTLVAIQLVNRRRKNRIPIQTVDEFEDDLEDDALDDDATATESTAAS